MKKVLLSVALMLLLAVMLVACAETPAITTGSETQGTTSGTESTVETTVPDTDYEAVIRDVEWVSDSIDFSEFDFVGSGSEVSQAVRKTFAGYSKNYYSIEEDGSKNTYSDAQLNRIMYLGAQYAPDDANKTVDVKLTPIEIRVEAAWESVTAKAGSYLMFDFTTNYPADFYMTVTAAEGGEQASAAYTQGGVTVTGKNGKYTGIAKCTVPYAEGETFYINICLDRSASKYPVLASIPVTITKAKYDSQYALMFQGDWELVQDPEYLPNLIDLFYNVYPRLYARFALGNEPKTITFMADKNYDGVAYCAGTTVCVSVDYANANPQDLGFFSHEITHSVQQYGTLNYGEDGETYGGKQWKAWWTENMANYGGFRYFHWGYSTKFVQIYSMSDRSLQDWGYEPYGNNKVFFAYMDAKYPTTDKNNDGKITVNEYGLIDAINYLIKTSTVKLYDTPTNPNTPMNKKVKEITGFSCFEDLRKQFAKECQEGTWAFTGFADYVDNFITEDLDGIPNPNYPTLAPVTKGDTTHEILDSVITEGNNVAQGAVAVEFSGEDKTHSFESALDGDLTTYWNSTPSLRKDHKYELGGYPHGFVIDLGETKSFDTYTLVNYGYISGTKQKNTVEWEVLISDDGTTWTSVDYQSKNSAHAVSVEIGEQSARYVQVRVYSTSFSQDDEVNIVDFMLFD